MNTYQKLLTVHRLKRKHSIDVVKSDFIIGGSFVVTLIIEGGGAKGSGANQLICSSVT